MSRVDRDTCATRWDPPAYEVSLIMAWRNDDYGGAGAIERFQRTLTVLDWQVNKTGASLELIIVEYNPPPDRPRLRDVVVLPVHVPSVRVIEMPASFEARVQSYFPGLRNVPTPFAESRNMAIRRARGRYVVPFATNSVLTTSFFERLAAVPGAIRASERGHARIIHRIPKYYVDADVPASVRVPEELEAFLVAHAKNPTFKLTSDAPSLEAIRETEACADFQMMSRENWDVLRAYWECPSYAHHDSILQYNAEAERFLGVAHQGMMVLHQWHPEGGFHNNLQVLTVPQTDYRRFMKTGLLNPNSCDWGYPTERFAEWRPGEGSNTTRGGSAVQLTNTMSLSKKARVGVASNSTVVVASNEAAVRKTILIK